MDENVFDYITLSDNSTIIVNYTPNLTDEVIFSDGANIFDVFKVNTSSEAIIVDVSDGNISDYIKTVQGDVINFTDDTSTRIDFNDKLEDNIIINDDTVAHLSISQSINDSFNIRTRAYADVHYNNNNNDSDNIELSDSVFAIVSKLSTRRFKNSFLNSVGIIEEIAYTCSGKSTIMMNISLCNRLLSDVLVDVLLYKNGVTATYIMKGILVKPHQSYVINSNNETNIVLEDTDEIRVVTDTNNSSDIYMALMEQI